AGGGGAAARRHTGADPAAAEWREPAAHRNSEAATDQPALDIDDVAPADADAALSRSNGEAPMGYSEWAGTGAGGRDNTDYNLEAFVSVETTLADHLAEQLALSVADPARRMIGQYLIHLLAHPRYLNAHLAPAPPHP